MVYSHCTVMPFAFVEFLCTGLAVFEDTISFFHVKAGFLAKEMPVTCPGRFRLKLAYVTFSNQNAHL